MKIKYPNPRTIYLNTRVTILILAGIAALVPANHLAAQGDLAFSSGSNGSDGALVVPSSITARSEVAAAYDAARNEVVVFGGLLSSTSLADTYVFDGEAWTARLPANSPPARHNHAMAYDAARSEVVLFGGSSDSGDLGDTWTWNGVNWTQESPAMSPNVREGAVMAYDEVRQEVVLFGGITGSTRQSDTWVWNGTTWTQRSPATSPSARDYSAMVWDGTNNRVFLFGGYSTLGDTWAWNGTTWSIVPSAVSPPGRHGHSMAYDPISGNIILHGSRSSSAHNDTWIFVNGSGWEQVFPVLDPTGAELVTHYHAAMVYSPEAGQVIHIGGRQWSGSDKSRVMSWDGTNWNWLTGGTWYFDMTGRPSGTWNYSTIDVPQGVTVVFISNTANTPVTWLATGNVNINGTLQLSGQTGFLMTLNGQVSKAGPGGFDGGSGGIAFNNSSSYVGSPGSGPGGGTAGTNPFDNNLDGGGNAGYFNVYGNNFIVPMIGGSGGGGTASGDTANGSVGGAGGGAILIASSRDIFINGDILARGGDRFYSNPAGDYSGRGSGGAVKLVADRVNGTGYIDVRGGGNQGGSLGGRIRIEGFERRLTNQAHSQEVSASAPVADNYAVFLSTQPTLTITQVAGAAVTQPPSGNTGTPDVIFSSGGSVTVVVEGANVPDGTLVTVKISHEGGSTTLPAANMNAGSAVVQGIIPAGIGTLEATAQFTAN